MPGRWLHALDPRAESMPKGWHDEIVCHTIRRNGDGTITIIALINIYDDEGNCYSGERIVKLRDKRKEEPIPQIFMDAADELLEARDEKRRELKRT